MLMMGTVAHESRGGYYLDQVTGPDDDTLGPAYGIFQIEPHVRVDLYKNYLDYRPAHRVLVSQYCASLPDPNTQLATNLAYATIIARYQYYRHPEPLPKTKEGLAAYWKRYWNTPLGKGTEAQWLEAYDRYIKPIEE